MTTLSENDRLNIELRNRGNDDVRTLLIHLDVQEALLHRVKQHFDEIHFVGTELEGDEDAVAIANLLEDA